MPGPCHAFIVICLLRLHEYVGIRNSGYVYTCLYRYDDMTCDIHAVLCTCIDLAWCYPRWQAIVGPTLGNGWSCWQHVIVGVLTLAQHGTNTQVSTVEVRLLAQRWNFKYAPTVSCGAKHTCRQ